MQWETTCSNRKPTRTGCPRYWLTYWTLICTLPVSTISQKVGLSQRAQTQKQSTLCVQMYVHECCALLDRQKRVSVQGRTNGWHALFSVDTSSLSVSLPGNRLLLTHKPINIQIKHFFKGGGCPGYEVKKHISNSKRLISVSTYSKDKMQQWKQKTCPSCFTYLEQ